MIDLDSNFLIPLEPGDEGQLTEDKLNQIKLVASQYQLNVGNIVLVVDASAAQQSLTSSLLGKYIENPVYRVDLAQIVSKYIGETEKNLNQVFEVAEKKNFVLLFDEADALFAKRTEIKDAHDRFANMDASFLLERFEGYSGLVILTSKLRSNLDAALLRRMNWVIDFSEPVVLPRLSLWQRIFGWFGKP